MSQPPYVKLKHGGPDYIDPKKVMNSQGIEAEMQKIFSGKDKATKREDFVNEMWENFQSHAERDTVLTASQFEKYAILFNNELKEKVLNHTISEAETEMISELSQEFYYMVNTQRPIHIVDDVTGEEIMPPLPPIFMRLNKLKGAGCEAVNIFHNAHINDDNVAGGMHQIHKEKATENLSRMVAMSQNLEEIQDNIAKTDALVRDFHQKVHGVDIFNPTQEAKPTPAPATPIEKVESNPVTQEAPESDYLMFD